MTVETTSAAELDAKDPLASLRGRFSLPGSVIYLDGNSLGALPVGLAERLDRVIRHEWGNRLIRSWNEANWYELPLRVGDRIAPLLGVGAGEVVVGDSTSVSLFRVLAAAAQLRPDRQVVVTERGNFPTDLYILDGLRQLMPHLEVRFWNESEPLVNSLRGAAVLMLTHVDYRTGRIRDMRSLSAAAHEAGALTVWDLSHSTGILDLDIDRDGADFAVGCGYKYLNGGPGAPSFTWVAPALVDVASQPLSGWFGHKDPFAFVPGFEAASGIQRFLTGTQQVLSLASLDEALNVWEDVSMHDVRKKSIAQTERFIAGVERECDGRGLALLSPRNSEVRGGQVSFEHEEGYRIMQALISRGVIGDFRAPNVLRFGFSPLYVSFADIDRAVDILAEIMRSESWKQPQFAAKQTVT
ncbi:MAG: kynureninase [bacterium]|nr:kynureninase [Candidatus Aquidulcis frankliniae]